MRIPLDRSSPTPLYGQIESWFRDAIRTGALVPGQRLPSRRVLAADVGVSRITSDAAYAQLESAGLIVSRLGSGAVVADPLPRGAVAHPSDFAPAPPEPPPDLLAFTGVGDPRRFPVAAFEQTLREVLRREGAAALDYADDAPGDTALRATVVRLLASQGISVDLESVLITSGSQQGLALTCADLLRPGDAVLVESPTYDRALDLFRTRGLRLVGVPVDADGIRVDELERAIDTTGARLLYAMPTFQNPTGVTMTGARRRAVAALARTRSVTVFEDDFVGDLRYDGAAQPAILVLDPDAPVVFAGTFSKLLMPAIRVGYLVVPDPVLRERIIERKAAEDLGTSLLLQRAVDRFVTVGRYEASIRRSIRSGRIRRDALVDALQRRLPGAVDLLPRGGLFLWARLPRGIRSDELAEAARSAGVELAPGTRFFPDPEDGRDRVRLNFAALEPTEIERGVERLAAVVERLR